MVDANENGIREIARESWKYQTDHEFEKNVKFANIKMD